MKTSSILPPSRHRRGVGLALLLWLAAAVVTAAADEANETEARERLARAMSAVLSLDDAGSLRARARAERAGTHAETTPGAPVVEWQSEGLGSGFDREANAADSVRLRKEVALFGQRSGARSYRLRLDNSTRSETRVALLELAARAGREWLDWAAAVEFRDLVAHRLERFDRALALHRKRLELGEVAGTEVRQLELQRARDGAELRAASRRVGEVQGRLRRLAGDVDAPAAGDLRALVDDLAATTIDAEGFATPWLDAAEARRLAEESRGAFVAKTAWGYSEVEAELQRIPGLGGEPSFESFGFRLAVPLPVGATGRARRAQAAADADAARAEERATRRELGRRLDEARQRLATAETVLAELDAFEAGLPNVEHSLAEQFRLGSATYLTYIDGLSRLDELRADLIDTRLELLLARLELAMLTGNSDVFPIPAVTLEESK